MEFQSYKSKEPYSLIKYIKEKNKHLQHKINTLNIIKKKKYTCSTIRIIIKSNSILCPFYITGVDIFLFDYSIRRRVHTSDTYSSVLVHMASSILITRSKYSKYFISFKPLIKLVIWWNTVEFVSARV
jgi:hypothetical protein